MASNLRVLSAQVVCLKSLKLETALVLRNVARQKTALSVSWYVDFDFSDRIGLEPLSGVAVAFVLADFGFATAVAEMIVISPSSIRESKRPSMTDMMLSASAAVLIP